MFQMLTMAEDPKDLIAKHQRSPKMAKPMTYDRLVHALERATDRTKRRDDAMYRDPSVHAVVLKRQALVLAHTLLDLASEAWEAEAEEANA